MNATLTMSCIDVVGGEAVRNGEEASHRHGNLEAVAQGGKILSAARQQKQRKN